MNCKLRTCIECREAGYEMGIETKASKPDDNAEVDGWKRKRSTSSLLPEDNIVTGDDVFIAIYKFTISTF